MPVLRAKLTKGVMKCVMNPSTEPDTTTTAGRQPSGPAVVGAWVDSPGGLFTENV